MDPGRLRQIFFGECDDYLGSADEAFDRLRTGDDVESALNGLFRSVHSIKGGARAFGLERLAEVAHHFETFMDRLRKGLETLDDASFGRLTLGFDMLSALVAEARGETTGPVAAAAFIAELRLINGEDAAPGAAPDVAEPVQPAEPAAVMRSYRLRIEPAVHMFTAGADPLHLFRNLAELGALTTTAELGRIPRLAELVLDTPYLSWTIELETEAPRTEIEEMLGYVDDVVSFELTEPAGSAEDGKVPANGGEEPVPAAPAPTPAAAAAPLPRVAAPPFPAPPPVRSADTGAAPRDERRVQTVRVDVPKLERLGNMVGELVIAQAVLQRQAADIPEADRPGLFRAIKDMSQYIRDLQDIAMAVRAQPLRTAFSRLLPVARELERATGKRFRVMMSGEDTEVDKTVVDRLAEPLTHLLRNSVDHGLEPADRRAAAGKPAEGTILLSARQKGSHVHIVIADDGGGIDRAAVRRRAAAQGLIDGDADLSENEVDNLIFLPGFSTAQMVTEVSGRGVGLDAVRQVIADLGGHIVVESTPGAGTSFILVLPLSLAIIDVLVAEVGRQRYLLPIGNVIESLRPTARQIVAVPGRGQFLLLRGMMLPIVSLAEEFNVPEAVSDPTRAILIIVELRRGHWGALLVDGVLSEEPVVVRSLERNYRKVPGIAAATILGDGRAALIVDPAGLSGLAGGPLRSAEATPP